MSGVCWSPSYHCIWFDYWNGKPGWGAFTAYEESRISAAGLPYHDGKRGDQIMGSRPFAITDSTTETLILHNSGPVSTLSEISHHTHVTINHNNAKRI